MHFLLDTHTLLWSLFDPKQLGQKAAQNIQDPDMTVLVSVVSFWEISLKYSIGKLDLGNILPDEFPEIVRQSGFDSLPLTDTDAATFHNLPRKGHKDPFDRLIAWQAITHNLTLITPDRAFAEYHTNGLRIVW
jgi:PIN domain nuclease of toxin-antitoxin system